MNRREAMQRIGAGVAGMSTLMANGAPPPVVAASPTARTMLSRPIPSSGEMLPAMGMGTWLTFDVDHKPAARAPLEEVMTAFTDVGGRLLDSSAMYGRSEEVVGDIIDKLNLHSRTFIATKVWTTGKTAGILQMEDSMRKLRVSVVDLMQVHNLLDVETHLDTLAEWKRRGKVRYVGVTHYTSDGAAALAKLIANRKLDFVQINYSVGERDAEKRLLPLARDRGVAVITSRPFAAGSLLKSLSHKPLPGWAADIECKTWAQALLKFVISNPIVNCAIPASSKVKHVQENMDAGFGRMPDKALRARIAADAMALR